MLIVCKFDRTLDGMTLSVNILKYKAPMIPVIFIKTEIITIVISVL